MLTNLSSYPLYYIVNSTQPAATTQGSLALPEEEVFVSNQSKTNVWVKASRTSMAIFVQGVANPSAEYNIVDLPASMYTSQLESYKRIRVDPEQTSFFLGTQFTTFYEISLAAAASLTIKFERTVDVVVKDLQLSVNDGTMRLDSYRNSTPAGTWGTTLPIIEKSSLSTRPTPFYTSTSTITTGGTITGGVAQDLLIIKVPSATAQASTIAGESGERGVPGGSTGYYKITNTGSQTVTGVFKLWWEERP